MVIFSGSNKDHRPAESKDRRGLERGYPRGARDKRINSKKKNTQRGGGKEDTRGLRKIISLSTSCSVMPE